MSEKRELWIDVVKGITILFVMWCHVQVKSPVFNWIAAICVPVFLVLTGYLYAPKDSKTYSFKKSIKRILVPYLIFSIISIIVYFIYDYYFSSDKYLINLRTNIIKSISRIWYLDNMVFAIIFYLHKYLLANKKSK